ncbi:MAG: NADP-dependent oxidoreductase, partial [Schleiferilactobacillus harbinensis]|uniref:NADP-dependent oxidoreductase n=1 Tax=Schleiferilactobacillus harbinensis TaxID=304207 RepID=UPI0039ED9171
MQAFGFDKFGGPAVFQTIEKPTPTPKAGQVAIDVIGFGFNPYDASLRRGDQATARPLPFPIIPGQDVVGKISALGEGVTDYAIGDIVMNHRPLRGYSEVVTASLAKVAPKSAALSFLDAAALPNVGTVAYALVHSLGQLQKGQNVAVIGASGSVGSLAVQLAKYAGARVLAIAGERHKDFIHWLTPDDVYYYDGVAKRDNAWAQRFDLVVDAATMGANGELAAWLVKPTGIVTTVGETSTIPAAAGVTLRAAGGKQKTSDHDILMYFNHVADTYGLTIRVADNVPFSAAGVQQAHELLDQGGVPGKIVAVRPHGPPKPHPPPKKKKNLFFKKIKRPQIGVCGFF